MNSKDKFDIVFRRKLVETFSALIAFLDENELTWWAGYGTVIGAVRHGGMIPWDDDIDICMPRKEFDRLGELREKLNSTKYEIMLPNDNGYILDFAKFCDKTTTVCETSDSLFGVYVDIFPLDDCSLSFDEFASKVNYIQQVHGDYLSVVSSPSMAYVWNLVKHFRVRAIRGLMERQAKKKRLVASDVLKEYQSLKWPIADSEYYVQTTIGFYGVKERFPKTWFRDCAIINFEDIQIRIPIDYHEYLTHLYGDYMKLPPIYARKTHHCQFYVNLKERITLDEARKRRNKGEVLVY